MPFRPIIPPLAGNGSKVLAVNSGATNVEWADTAGGGPHTHPISDVLLLQTALDGKQASGSYAAAAHNHDAAYSAIAHTHAGVYEPANANIQTHVGGAHAPSNAQKNSDITKAEIEAALTGAITSHTHAAADPFTKLILAGNQATGANVTPVTLSGMVFSFAANSKYLIDGVMLISAAAATTGCGFQWDVSTAVTTLAGTFSHQLANAGTLSGGSSIADDASVGVSSGVPTLNVMVPVAYSGLLISGANSGTAQLRFRSETTAVITCLAGSMLRVLQMA